ncbi:hypothetical protein LX87_01490 [Larkinella arboricola]|uniref:Uncharacterized protein n=1 Tax=Larkinella arboricola TaxID=643671 RepID=A0A327X2J6_LARAB|nr:hypothetical protein LX87_01490 [Larkinella arboricola]
MRNSVPKEWKVSRPGRRVRFEIDQISLLGVLTVMIFAYILFHFVYPIISKGLLW